MKILKALSLILQCVKLAMDLWERFGGKWHFLVLYTVFIRENCCHSPGCITMQPGEIYLA